MSAHQATASEAEHQDYHGHPDYMKTYVVLLVLFVLSLGSDLLNEPMLAMVLIFGMAIVKILYVVMNFMHLRFEPWSMWFAMIFGLMCCAFFYFGVYPDLLWVNLEVVPR